ncbi:MAG TPA: hypothetical protein VMV62_02215 [Candidatus Paceibacterota bacterium]|nr:hypothetical protein [Candidatus Paceibacterota bacterium]
MSFLESLFHKKEYAESVILIDIGADTVAGAYARYQDGELPTILYTRRLPIEIRADEAHDRAMLRALELLGADLVREGAPALARATGSGSASRILVSIDAPWQETHVHTEHFEQEDSFVFTKELVEAKLKESAGAPSEKLLADTSIIGITLNGYDTNNPYGRRVHRASVIALTSLIERDVAKSILSMLERLYHTKDISPIAGSSLRYQAMRSLFPHERDAIIIDATGRSLTSVSLIRKGMFVTMVDVMTHSDADDWASAVTGELADLAKHYPLPRTIFLLAREQEVTELRKKLDTTTFAPLWFGDAPPKIVVVLKSLVGSSVRQMTTNTPGLALLLMALYFRDRHSGSGAIR